MTQEELLQKRSEYNNLRREHRRNIEVMDSRIADHKREILSMESRITWLKEQIALLDAAERHNVNPNWVERTHP